MNGNKPDHWIQLARNWNLRGRPAKPGPDDLRILEREFRQWHEATRRDPLRVLLLGVTPEIATMPWPAGTRFLALDRSRAMIQYVWPGAALGFQAVCGMWPALPLADATQDRMKPSSRRKPGSRHLLRRLWIPAFAGMT